MKNRKGKNQTDAPAAKPFSIEQYNSRTDRRTSQNGSLMFSAFVFVVALVLAIVSCMDTRLTALLLAALGLKNGDAKIIKVAGAEVAHPFGSVMRSLLIAVCELGVEDIMIVAHTNCGAQHMSGKEMVANMERLGVSAERIEFARHCGIDFDKWLAGFGDTEEAVRKSVDMVANHPVMPPHVRVIGFIMDSDTGELTQVNC